MITVNFIIIQVLINPGPATLGFQPSFIKVLFALYAKPVSESQIRLLRAIEISTGDQGIVYTNLPFDFPRMKNIWSGKGNRFFTM